MINSNVKENTSIIPATPICHPSFVWYLSFSWTRVASHLNTPLNTHILRVCVWEVQFKLISHLLQEDLHSPPSEIPHVQVQRARDAEWDGGDEGAEDKPPQGLLQLQKGSYSRTWHVAAKNLVVEHKWCYYDDVHHLYKLDILIFLFICSPVSMLTITHFFKRDRKV